MPSHWGTVVLYVLSGLVVTLFGALTIRYPEASYAIRTGWKHDEASLSSTGRADQKVMGAILVLIGVGLIFRGLT